MNRQVFLISLIFTTPILSQFFLYSTYKCFGFRDPATCAVLSERATRSMLVGHVNEDGVHRAELAPQSPRCSHAGISPNTTNQGDNHRVLRVNVPIYDNGWAITAARHPLTVCTCDSALPLKSLLLHSVFAGSCDEKQLKHLAPYKRVWERWKTQPRKLQKRCQTCCAWKEERLLRSTAVLRRSASRGQWWVKAPRQLISRQGHF